MLATIKKYGIDMLQVELVMCAHPRIEFYPL